MGTDVVSDCVAPANPLRFGINRIDLLDRDLTALWKIDIDGKVNGAVETCFGTEYPRRKMSFLGSEPSCSV
ncbi:hypothetical protein ZIOFF_033888 [Zingiber officinale]|uniref:Uncharacterized protein n=1 Tax=Zingiber officinale TaxID=94328 RepID=A0A8J5GK70_ZINOF|nr:hypothetical protein ZIOFF_033888 [Zingiber officinale]